MRLPAPLPRSVRRFLGREDGNSTLEFVIAFPLVMMIFMSVFEAAMVTARHTMLERALDMTVRNVRLSTGSAPTQDQMRRVICDRAVIIPDCERTLIIEMTPVPVPAFTMPSATQPCYDRAEDIEPVVSYTQAVGNQMMLIRACAVVDPMFPLTGPGLSLTKDPSGGLQLITSSAFVAEP